MEEETKAKKEKKLKALVYAQIPTQEIKTLVDKDGNEYEVVTVEDALTEILEIARDLKKGLL